MQHLALFPLGDVLATAPSGQPNPQNSLDPAMKAGPARRHTVPWAGRFGKVLSDRPARACATLWDAVAGMALSVDVIMADPPRLPDCFSGRPYRRPGLAC
jgi:hypothetical protein